MYITLDKRKHNDRQVITEEWKELQGPALLFWNDSTFSEEDLRGIQSLGLGSKANDAKTIGQYGIGFNVVYHYTDCPSFVTNDQLCILDPYRCYISRTKGERPGRRFKGLEELWKRFPDMKSPYLLGEAPNKGSLFRLPLRQTAKHTRISNEVIIVQALEDEIKEWMSQASEALLFLHNVSDLKFFVVDEGKSTERLIFSAQSHKDKVNMKVSESGNSRLFTYPVTLFTDTKDTKQTQWIVQLGEGNFVHKNFKWTDIAPNVTCVPHHGIAVPINEKNLWASHFVIFHYQVKPICQFTYMDVLYYILIAVVFGLVVAASKTKARRLVKVKRNQAISAKRALIMMMVFTVVTGIATRVGIRHIVAVMRSTIIATN